MVSFHRCRSFICHFGLRLLNLLEMFCWSLCLVNYFGFRWLFGCCRISFLLRSLRFTKVIILFSDNVKDYVATDEETKKTIAYICWAILGVLVIFILCMYSRIKLAIAIVKTGAMFVMNVKSTLLVPILMSILSACLFAVYIVGFVYNYSTGTITSDDYGIATV